MQSRSSLTRQSHFLGTKIRNLRKRNHLTMEDLSSRCIKVNAEAAPSVSYLSMIERGKRVPSEEMLEVIAKVFQKDLDWFLDGVPEEQNIIPMKGRRGGITGMVLEPSFLFSNDILQIAIPEMLSQTGTTGRQFAHLLIRAYQEHHLNHFPDLERAAEEIGKKRMPLSVDEMLSITRSLDLNIHWFQKFPRKLQEELQLGPNTLVSSFFDPSGTIYLNKVLKTREQRLKYELAVSIGHAVLHNKDGMKSVMVVGEHEEPNQNTEHLTHSSTVDAKDILYAWRDFECSFFAGALLCPKVPFRQLLDHQGYDIRVSRLADVSYAVAMRRMTAVSPYPHWHFFDAYAPGKLKAVYRGNGIPLPWGNMRMVEDPCQHWAVFRMINEPLNQNSAQISILEVGHENRIYCCESVRVEDLAGNRHVLCAGIDLNPAIEARGSDAFALAQELKEACVENDGSVTIPQEIKIDLLSVAKILNISWIERGIENEARLICTRGTVCPRQRNCLNP